MPITYNDFAGGETSELTTALNEIKTVVNDLDTTVSGITLGAGSVDSVNGVLPVAGDVTLTPADIGAAATADVTAVANDLIAEAATRAADDVTLQDNIDTVTGDLSDHEAETDPHSGAVPRDGSRALTADMDAGGFVITNAADGVAATDLATVGQLTLAAAGFAPRLSVRVATAAALPANTRSTNTLTANANGSINGTGIDGVTDLTVGQRVLVKNESTGANNGVYEITVLGNGGTAWEMLRASDFDASGEATLGAYYPVDEGATNGSSAWYLATDSVTLNTTALVFTRDARSNGEVNTTSNAGTGDGQLAKAKSGTNLPIKTLTAGSGIDITNGTDEVTITVDPSEFNLDDVGGTLDETNGGTGLTTYTLGDTIYSSAANTLAKLSGNATTTRKFLRQTGTGAASAAPAWDTLLGADLPAFVASGPSHAKGAVPDPGATAGTTRYLCEDATFRVPPGSGGFTAESTSSKTIPTGSGGSMAWSIGIGYAFAIGQQVRVARTSDPTTYIGGIVTSYPQSGPGYGTLTLTVNEYAGSGTFTDWTLSAGGAPASRTPRVGTATSSATPTINTNTVDMYILTAQAADITSFTTNLSGTPVIGQKLWIAIVGTAARAITWGASFESSTVTLPSTTISTDRLDVGFVWTGSKWRCVAVA